MAAYALVKGQWARRGLAMPRFVVRVGYDWVAHNFRDVEIDAPDADAAERAALQLSTSDRDFWADGIEDDGEAGPNEIVSVEPAGADDGL
jgi:hypothetical protein